ncbi:hypothetical protein [Streptomyces sudanensis]|nr:hypothetical protein [Streptomyces sudanensis]MCP9956147.1 hypothetical protein [Streptomyces sudanensis]MCQ0003216.1 hypothetical protein [Streptomyces sudanensis]
MNDLVRQNSTARYRNHVLTPEPAYRDDESRDDYDEEAEAEHHIWHSVN